MSFDLHFQPCRFDGTTEERLNPVTKQLQKIPRNEPLSEEQAAAVLGVLKRASAHRSQGDEANVLRFPDGGQAEIFAEDLRRGCMIAIRGPNITPALAELLFDVLVAGDWVLLGEEDVVLTPSHDCMKGMPSFFGQVIVVRSPDEVGAVLSGGAEAWKKYRASLDGR